MVHVHLMAIYPYKFSCCKQDLCLIYTSVAKTLPKTYWFVQVQLKHLWLAREPNVCFLNPTRVAYPSAVKVKNVFILPFVECGTLP